MQILGLCDDKWHPAATPRAGLAPLAQAGYGIDWIEDGREWQAAQMARYRVVALVKCNHTTQTDNTPWVTDEVISAFRGYVAQGHGLLVIHSGTIYRNLPGMRSLIGGAFIQHPPQCAVTIAPGAPSAPSADHALTVGVEPFTVKDEHYFMEVDDPAAAHFLTTTSEHGTQSGGWTRQVGAGRVCVLTPGHNLEVWQHSGFQTLLHNALAWCGGQG